MGFEDKVNVYINSKNRASSETVSKFNVVIPQGLLRLYNKDEYWTLNVNFFSAFNSWYNCMDNFNNQFQLVYHDNNGVETLRLDFKLTHFCLIPYCTLLFLFISLYISSGAT
mgnify:CR=1 FL=1